MYEILEATIAAVQSVVNRKWKLISEQTHLLLLDPGTSIISKMTTTNNKCAR